MDSYEFVELSPNEDSYYYLLIKSNSIIKFKVKVTTFGKQLIIVPFKSQLILQKKVNYCM